MRHRKSKLKRKTLRGMKREARKTARIQRAEAAGLTGHSWYWWLEYWGQAIDTSKMKKRKDDK